MISSNSHIFKSGLGCAVLLLSSQQLFACNADAWTGGFSGNVSTDTFAQFEELCGLNVQLSGTAAWVEDQTPGILTADVTKYVARFYAYIDGAQLADGESLSLLTGLDSTDSDLFAVDLVGTAAGLELQIAARDGSSMISSSGVDLAPGWRALEITWSSADNSASFAMDGNGDLATLVGLNNAGDVLAKVRLGSIPLSAAPTGSIDLDSFVSRLSGSIGLIDKSCSGSTVNVNNITFLPGSKNCSASDLSFGERVVFDPGSVVTVNASTVAINGGFYIPAGAVFLIQ